LWLGLALFVEQLPHSPFISRFDSPLTAGFSFLSDSERSVHKTKKKRQKKAKGSSMRMQRGDGISALFLLRLCFSFETHPSHAFFFASYLSTSSVSFSLFFFWFGGCFS
jgi:hypothetical protein